MTRMLILLTALVWPLSVHSQTADSTLPATPAGKMVASYIGAFNSADLAAMREFFEKHLAEKARKDLPVEERLVRAGQMKEMVGTLSFARLAGSDGHSIRAIMRGSKAGWLEYTFELDPEDPHGLLFVRVEEVEDPAAPPVHPFPDVRSFGAATEEYLRTAEARGEFSGVVMIARGDTTLLLKAYGNADREKGIANTVTTRFNVGSINKSFTRVAILQLESQGKLSLDDPIGKFIPDYPNRTAADKVTVGHLLEMRSGIGDFFGERYDGADKEKIRTLADYLPLFADKPLEFEPGTGRRYSNGGYVVLGIIIERVSGIDYYRYIEQHVFSPAGMQASGWFEKSDRRQDIAKGYAGRERRTNYNTLPQKGSSAGGGYCTAGDLLKYVRAIQAGVLRLPGTDQGMGIAGGAPGLNAALEWIPDRGYVVIVLSNFDPPGAEKVARRIRQTLP